MDMSLSKLRELVMDREAWHVVVIAYFPIVAQMVKNPPGMQETWAQFLGQENPSGDRNGNPLQYSCLENPMDKGVW